MFRTIYFPSEPFGGAKELKELVKQEIVYPDSLLIKKESGEVFITYLIDSEGKVVFKEVVDYGREEFREEAERIFDNILWVADKTRENKTLGHEKIKFIFSPKAYKKVVKKRGYNKLPYPDLNINKTPKYYSINELEVKPSVKNANSVNAFISKNIQYPPIAHRMNISGRVTIDFIIEPYGLVSNARIIEPLAGGCNEETIRLVKAMKWEPGILYGEAVRTLYRYQLNFVHPGGTVR